MKAMDFLEWFLDVTDRHEAQGLTPRAVRVSIFLSQPFKPEMITEYFEGWKEKQSEVYMSFAGTGLHSVTNIIELYFDKIDMITYGNNIIRNDFTDQIYRVPKPKTLNDFISDCNRAGIELTWKPEIEKRFQ